MASKNIEELAKKLYQRYSGSEESGEEITSREFKIFSGAGALKKPTWYEKVCKWSGKLFKYSVPKNEKEEVDNILQSFNMDITAEDTQSFAIIFLLAVVILGGISIFFSILFSLVIFSLGTFGFFYFKNYPQRLMNIRRAKASTEIILAVLYMVIYMKIVSNLESALRFAAENLEGPLATDFKKLIWDISNKKYTGAIEALTDYVEKWKKYNEAFVDSIYLLQTSLVQKSEDRRLMLLDQALKRILDGTYESMVHYVNDLRTPVSAIFMLGITLPILGLVMLPLIGAFLAGVVSTSALFIFYDVLLPAFVILIIMQILATRPSAFGQVDVFSHPLAPPKDHFIFMKRPVKAIFPAILVFLILLTPYAIYFFTLQDNLNPKELDVVFSLFFIFSIAGGISTYGYLATKDFLKIRQQIKDVEKDFSYAIFQIGNRLAEGVPAEIAMVRTAKTMKESKISNFIKIIANNIQKLGFDLKRAIFDPKYGALAYYPSSLVKSVMKIFLESTKESQEIASASLNHVSNYLLSVHQIEEKIKDVLSETISTLKFQSSFIAPLISGIIVGLTSMIMIILSVLGKKISGLSSATASPGAGVAGLSAFGFFEISNTIPLANFQIIVGIYLIEIVIISVVFASKIENGDDYLYERSTVAKSLMVAMAVYFAIALIVTIAFSALAKLAIAVGEF